MFVKNNQISLQCRACGRSSPANAKGKAAQKEVQWIIKHIDNEELQPKKLQSDKEVNSLEDFEVPGADMF